MELLLHHLTPGSKMCSTLPHEMAGGVGGLSKKVTLNQVPGSQVLLKPPGMCNCKYMREESQIYISL